MSGGDVDHSDHMSVAAYAVQLQYQKLFQT
jgi:hypothetical protein